MTAEFTEVMSELESLGTEHTKRSYLSRGACEPLFGVATGAMKPLKKRVGVNQALAQELWNSGNYDAMYFAGMIADARAMTEADFDRWMDGATYPMVADFVVSVTLAESDVARAVADRWIGGDDPDRAATGWTCYEWLLGWRPDSYFEPEAVRDLLGRAVSAIHGAPPRLKRAMNSFIVAVGVSYLPLHEEALSGAEKIGPVEIVVDGTPKTLPDAAQQIRKAADKGRIGFKRRAVRC